MNKQRKTSFSLTLADARELNLLKEHFDESASAVIRRSLILLSYITKNGINLSNNPEKENKKDIKNDDKN